MSAYDSPSLLRHARKVQRGQELLAPAAADGEGTPRHRRIIAAHMRHEAQIDNRLIVDAEEHIRQGILHCFQRPIRPHNPRCGDKLNMMVIGSPS